MLDDESSADTARHPASVHPLRPVRRAVLLAATALVVLVWSAKREVVCAAAGSGPDGSLDMLSPCPALITRTGAAMLSAGVVVLGLFLLLVARRLAWARRPGAERLLFGAFVVVTAGAVVAALFSTGFAPTI